MTFNVVAKYTLNILRGLMISISIYVSNIYMGGALSCKATYLPSVFWIGHEPPASPLDSRGVYTWFLTCHYIDIKNYHSYNACCPAITTNKATKFLQELTREKIVLSCLYSPLSGRPYYNSKDKIEYKYNIRYPKCEFLCEGLLLITNLDSFSLSLDILWLLVGQFLALLNLLLGWLLAWLPNKLLGIQHFQKLEWSQNMCQHSQNHPFCFLESNML